jgi:hypothetical protein
MHYNLSVTTTYTSKAGPFKRKTDLLFIAEITTRVVLQLSNKNESVRIHKLKINDKLYIES